MKQLNWYQIFGQTHTIPDGRTVTPTDDIQIWLNCANIWDKTYTTLAEVLADTTTLLALINSPNAVDYMVRSTTWAVSVAIVPKMTSNTTPSGEVIYSSYRGSDYAPWRAFDGNDSTIWQCYRIQAPQYIGYHSTQQFKAGYIRYRINGLRNQSGKIQGSNDGSTWVDLTEEVSFNQPSSNWYTENLTKNIDNYDRYRVYLTSIENKDGSNRYADFYEIQFYTEVGVTENSTAMSYIGLNNYCANTLLADSTWNEAIQNSEYFELVDNVKVPAMTDDTHPSGIAYASAVRGSGFEAYLAFDNNASTQWQAFQVSPPQYIYYKFPIPKRVFFMTMLTAASRIYTFKVQSSNDGITWVDRTDSINLTTSSKTTHKYPLVYNDGEYEYYRVYFSSFRDTNNVQRADIFTLQFYGREDV